MSNEQAREEPTNLSVSDIKAVLHVIDVCAKRGAFEASEFTVVGALRSKFATIIQQNTEVAETEEEK